MLKSCIQRARRISAGPVTSWKPVVTQRWRAELDRLGGLLSAALSDPTPLALFRALFEFLCAPGCVLAECFSEKQKRNPFSTVDDTVNAALHRVLKGQERKALRALCSNGVASVDDRVTDVLRALHPQRLGPLNLPPASGPQLVVDEQAVHDRLFADAADSNLSKDVYGWAPWLLFPWRAEKNGFFSLVVRFSCLLVNKSHLFPPVCALLLASGALTPLHKLSLAERLTSEQAGLPPKLRPINSGSMLCKLALSSVLQTPAADRAAERVKPQQLSLGVPRGIERMIHTCRAAFSSGWLVGRNDFVNGFNSMDRERMLSVAARLFPEATGVLNFFYGVDAPVYLLDEDLNVTTLLSQQGPRQGCAAGTFLFCLGIAPLVEHMQALFPEFSLMVLTDDIVPLVPPPSSDTPDGWETLFTRYAAFLEELKKSALELAGLSLNFDKCGLLLPEFCPSPSPLVRGLFPPGFEFQTRGFRVAGSPIGTMEFMAEFCDSKLRDAASKLQAIKGLGSKSARVTHRLLTSCGTKLLTFLAATVPPSVMSPVLESFDKCINSAFFSALSPVPFECSKARFDRAELRTALPAPFGCGLFRAADQGRAAWLSSLAACLSDPLLFRLRMGLQRDVDFAWTHLVDGLGGPSSSYFSSVSQILPSSAAAFLDGSLFSPSSDGFKLKLSKVILKTLSRSRVDAYKRSISMADISDTLTSADVLRGSAPTQAGLVFTSSLKFNLPFVLTNEQYVSWTCAFLGLPPPLTIGNPRSQVGFDYLVQRCLTDHRGSSPFLDVDGGHAASGCPSSHAGRLRKHNFLVRVLARAAKEAGLRISVEPDTFGLLLGEFSKAECRRIFPKCATKLYKERFLSVLQAVEFVASPSCTLDAAAKQAYVQLRIDALPAPKRDDTTGLRIDLSLEDEATGEARWVDVTAVHTGAESYRDKELKALLARQLTAGISSSLAAPDPFKADPSPTLVERTTTKSEKYSRLVLVAKKQAVELKRRQAPTFNTFAVSDYGELSPSAVDLVDWLVSHYRAKCTAEPRVDGCKPLELVRDFRYRIRLGLQLALVAGCGEMLYRAGQRWR